MALVENLEQYVMEYRRNAASDAEHTDGMWLNLVELTPDPPDGREKCENCLFVEIFIEQIKKQFQYECH